MSICLSEALRLAGAVLVLFVGMFSAAFAQDVIKTKAPHAIILDYDSGEVLYEKDARTPMEPASMSKLMTVAVLFDMIKNGELTLDTQFKVSKEAWKRGAGSGESKMWVLVDTEISVRDLLRGIIVLSGNDACQVVAENIAGSEEAFAVIMNRKAKEWGLTQSRFANATGMPDPEQLMSAYDLALLTRKIIRDYPGFYPIFSEAEFTWSKITQANRNPLLQSVVGADGMKTGHTDGSGYGVVGTAIRDGKRRIIVVNGFETSAERAVESTRLLDQAFSVFDSRVWFQPGEIVGNADVFMGKQEQVGLTVDTAVGFLTFRSALDKAKAEIIYRGPLRAPIEKGEQVAILRVEMPGQKPIEFPLFAAETINEIGMFGKMSYGMKSLLTPPPETVESGTR